MFQNLNKGITPTPEQMAAITSPEPVVVINAVAGSGKTAVLMEMAKRYRSGLYLAFSKSMANEIKPKLPMGWSCKTFNAFGYMLCRENIMVPEVDFNKPRKWPNHGAADLAVYHMEMAGSDTRESWEATCDRFKVPYLFIEEARHTMQEMTNDKSTMSGTEMMYWPVIHGWKAKKRFPVVLVDEVQDLSALQLELIKLISTDKLVFVGDTNQAIFGFRGADVEAFDKVDQLYNPKKYDLTQSFRCPKQVISHVNHMVPSMWGQKTNGFVQRINHLPAYNLPDDCFILARHNAVLYKTAHMFFSNNTEFSTSPVIVRRLKKHINTMIGNCKTITEALYNAEIEYKERQKLYAKHRWELNQLNQEYAGIVSLLKLFPSIAHLQTFVNKLDVTSRGSSKRRLMSIHTAKGLENKEVILINPYFHESIKLDRKQPWVKRQEQNLYYVACTRSIKNLTLVESSP